jgi:XTP/dITP diphosphohydrolase
MSAPRARLVFATKNAGKLAELRALCADLDVEVLSAIDLATPEVDEDGDGLAANAIKKAREVSRATGLPALADDSGLEVDALGGAPGVYSARYAGVDGVGADAANNARLLEALAGVPPARRTARFRAVLALADVDGRLGDEAWTAEGVCEGVVLEAPRGTGGFGYDPLFLVPELGLTFAELGVGTKNDRSHRARAMAAMRPRLAGYFRLAKPDPGT